jgi:hypothetical protein
VDLSYQEMVNPSKSSRSEGLKAHLERKWIGLESALEEKRYG